MVRFGFLSVDIQFMRTAVLTELDFSLHDFPPRGKEYEDDRLDLPGERPVILLDQADLRRHPFRFIPYAAESPEDRFKAAEVKRSSCLAGGVERFGAGLQQLSE